MGPRGPESGRKHENAKLRAKELLERLGQLDNLHKRGMSPTQGVSDPAGDDDDSGSALDDGEEVIIVDTGPEYMSSPEPFEELLETPSPEQSIRERAPPAQMPEALASETPIRPQSIIEALLKVSSQESGAAQSPASIESDEDTPVAEIQTDGLLEVFQQTVSSFKAIEEGEGLVNWLQENNSNGCEIIADLGKYCEAIAAAVLPKNRLAGTLPDVEEFYVVRGPKFMMVTKPVDVFRSKQPIYTKTIAFTCDGSGDGLLTPSMYATSGWSEKMRPHEKLLDSRFWTDQVLKFAGLHNYSFRPSGFDGSHQNEVGTDFASHSENQIVLFTACDLVRRFFGYTLVEGQIKNLSRLKTLTNQPPIRVFVSEKACKPCRGFRNLVQKHAGLVFEFTFLQKKLAEIKPVTSGKCTRYYGKFANTTEEQLSGILSPKSTRVRTITQRRVTSKRQMMEDSSDDSEYAPSTANVPPRTPRRVRRQQGMITPADSPSNQEFRNSIKKFMHKETSVSPPKASLLLLELTGRSHDPGAK